MMQKPQLIFNIDEKGCRAFPFIKLKWLQLKPIQKERISSAQHTARM
jgi:hypothetical protein